MTEPESDALFGKGFVYSIALVIKHTFDNITGIRESNNPDSFFTSVDDHIQDLIIPDKLPQSLKDKVIEFRGFIKARTLPTEKDTPVEDIGKCVKMGEGILMDVDKYIFGLKDEKSCYS